MIGYVYVRDIPKLIVSGAVALLVLVGIGAVLIKMPGLIGFLRRSPDWVGLGIVLLVFCGSIAAGQWVWKRMEDRWPTHASNRHVREVMDLYKHSIEADKYSRSKPRSWNIPVEHFRHIGIETIEVTVTRTQGLVATAS